MNLFHSVFVLVCLCVHGVWGAIGTTTINCEGGTDTTVGSAPEEYEGDIEILEGIQPTDVLELESYLFPVGVTFLELIHTPGNSTATIKTKQPLDADALYESGGTLYYAIKCKNTAFTNKRELRVDDINDNPPVFEKKLYEASVSEVQAVGTDVLRVRAVDADVSTGNSRVNYKIQFPDPEEFELRSDGAIRIKSRLNYNLISQYSFTVEAYDVDDQKDTATVTIQVVDFDNLNPYYIHSLYQASIPENQNGPFQSVTPEAIKAEDGDKGLNIPVVYSINSVIPDEYQSNFNIDSNSGVISVTTALDREKVESITIQIQAAQQDDPAKVASAIVLVTIEDVNDNPAEFEFSEYTASVPENSPKDLFVLQAKVIDLDEEGFQGTLSVVPDTVPFSISQDGTIRVKEPTELDRETTSTFTFQIEVSEDPPATKSAVASVTITLLDENDNSPVFENTKYEGEVSTEQSVGMLVVKVEATDLDEGPNGQISYSIDIGNEEGYFSINQTTGEITLEKTIPFLENQILRFVLYVTAKDEGTVSRSSSVLVDIKAPGNSQPQFLQKTYEGKVEEELEAGAEVVKVTFLSVSPAVPVTLTVESEGDKFSIDQVTGMLTTKIKLDYELQTEYTVQVSISDGTSRDDATVMVEVLDVNDNSPVFEPSSISIDVPEDAIIGHAVTTVLATDTDSELNGAIRYTLEGSAGMFSVDPETGAITVVVVLDRETQDKYNLIAVAQDQGRPVRSANVSVVVTLTDVNDNAPLFFKQQYEASLKENTTVGTNVISVNATDPDEGSNAAITYHIGKQEPPSEPPTFSIDAKSGAISLAQTLDYSMGPRYTLEVEGRDEGSPSLTGTTVVIVWVEDSNNNAPKFSEDSYDVEVYENIAPGSPLISLGVTDGDKGGFSNGHFLMTSDVFSINNEGVIHLLSNSSLDRETRDSYMLQVVAVDLPVNGLSSTAEVNIKVLDINDNNPEFHEIENPLRFPEDKTGEVAKIQVTDPDDGDNGLVSLTTYSDGDVFSFSPDGALIVNKDLDRETKEVYDLLIMASDNGEPPRHNVTRILVILTDVNDNAPVFSQSTYSAQVLVKDVEKGDLVLNVSATDKDDGNNSLISYRFSSSSDMVNLDPKTGSITWSRDLTDITEDTLLELSVIAEDHGTPPKDATATVKIDIRILSLSDSMAFQNSTYTFSVKENEPEETAVGVVKVLTANPVTYKPTSYTDLFSVDDRGTITTLKMLDKEEQDKYIFEVEATDTEATPPITALTVVVIEVEDVNEAPVFEKETYTAEVFSVAPYGFQVLPVKASDYDVRDTEQLRYSVQESSSPLGIDSSSGLVYVLDLTAMGGKVITTNIKATDPSGLSATAQIQVTVKTSGSDNIAVIILNQPVHTVQQKSGETQEALEKALGWSIHIISVSAVNENLMTRKTTDKTSISFIAVESNGKILSTKEVLQKLDEESQSVKVELEKVYGPNVELEGANGKGSQESNILSIVLGVLLALSIVALIVVVVVSVMKFKRRKSMDSDQESFRIRKPEKQSFNSHTHMNPHTEPKENESHRSSSRSSDASERRSNRSSLHSNSKATSSF